MKDQERILTSVVITILLYIPLFFLTGWLDFDIGDAEKSRMNPVYVELLPLDTRLPETEEVPLPEPVKVKEPEPESEEVPQIETPKPVTPSPKDASSGMSESPGRGSVNPQNSAAPKITYDLSGEPELGPRWLIEDRPQSDAPNAGLEEYIPRQIQGRAADSKVVLGEAQKTEPKPDSQRREGQAENKVPYDPKALDEALSKASSKSTNGSGIGQAARDGKGSEGTGAGEDESGLDAPFIIRGSGNRKWRPQNIASVIEEALRPYASSLPVSIRITVTAVLSPDGMLRDLALSPSSGNLRADEDLKAAIMSNLRFDPLPDGIHEEPRVTITYEIRKKR